MCLLFGWIGMSYAQTVTILDQQTEIPLKGVMLINENPRAVAVTNANGQAKITAFRKGGNIQMHLMGYEEQSKSFHEIESAGFLVYLQQANLDLDEVVVSASRWHQLSKDRPSKIISITSDEVELQNPQTAADLLGTSGKVFVQKSQQGGGSPMIRGFATNRLVYTVDGVRMNTAIFRSGNLQNVINLDPFAMERTEVYFGPNSVIYGSDAIGGVMSFKTLTPQFSYAEDPLVTGKAVARYSSANQERTGHFDINVGMKKWAFVTSFSSWDFDHLRQGSHGPDDYLKEIYPGRQDDTDVALTQEDPLLQVPSGYSQNNLMQKVRFRPNSKWDFQFGFHFSETSAYGRYDRHNRYRNGTIRYAEWDYGPQLWSMNHLSVLHMKSTGLYDQMSLRLAQQTFKESRIDRSFNAIERNANAERVLAYSVNLDLIKNIGSANALYYGAEYVQNDVASFGTITDITTTSRQRGPARYPNADWSSIAIYLKDEMKISEPLRVIFGLRYNRYLLAADFSNNMDFYPFPFTEADINHGALTGSLGAVYIPWGSWTIKANIGTAFRAPNVDDIGKVFDSEPGAVTVPNPDLEAEYAYNVDLGLEKSFGDLVKVGFTGYYTRLRNAMVRRDFQLNGLDSIPYEGQVSQVQAIQNAAVANVYGIQAGVEVKLPSNFQFLFDFNYQKGEEELDDGTISPSRHAAPLFGVGRIQYHYENLILELNSIYQGKRVFEDLPLSEQGKDEIYAKDAEGNNYAPSWYTLNLKARYRLTEKLSLSGGLENITDQRYRPYSSGISGAGRNFILAIMAQF